MAWKQTSSAASIDEQECERFKRMIQDLLSGIFMTPFSGFKKIVLPWGSLTLLCFYFVGSQFACSGKIRTEDLFA